VANHTGVVPSFFASLSIERVDLRMARAYVAAVEGEHKGETLDLARFV
jgi:hypothetical protein